MEDRRTFWHGWLIVVTIGVMLFGFGMVLFPNLTRQLFGLLFFSSAQGLDGFGDRAVAYIDLVHGVLGAVMFSWGAALLWIVIGPFRRGSFEAWLALTISLLAWFLPDTALSLWSGFWQNAILNVVLLALFAVPIAATYKSCRESRWWSGGSPP